VTVVYLNEIALEASSVRGSTSPAEFPADAPAPTGNRPATRLGFAIPRAVGNAVTRNRVRRRLRAVFGALESSNRLGQGAWLVVVRPGATELSFSELSELVEGLTSGLTDIDAPVTGGVPT
jgi:ribonuclease P protein component